MCQCIIDGQCTVKQAQCAVHHYNKQEKSYVCEFSYNFRLAQFRSVSYSHASNITNLCLLIFVLSSSRTDYHTFYWLSPVSWKEQTRLPFFDQPDGRVFLIEKKKSILPIQRGIATVNHCQQRWLGTRQSLAEFTENLINHSTRETQAKRPKTIRLIFSLRNFTFIKKNVHNNK